VTRRRSEPGQTASARVRLKLEHAAAADGSGSVPVVYLEGEFDIDTAPEVDRFLRRRLGPFYQRRSLLIDLYGVTMVDSSFIGFLVRLVGEQRRGRGELVLARPVGHVRTVLGMVGLPNLVPVYESLDEAVRAVREARAPLIPPVFSAAG
jgi:anti-anti-sigma factor